MRIEAIIKTLVISLIVGLFTPQNVSAQTSPSAMIEKGYEEINKGNLEAGIKWIQNAAEMGNAKAQFYLGSFYYVGDGVTKDVHEAEKWIRKAAEQGDMEAQYYLGIMYYNGDSVEKDDVMAAKWFQKSAEQGNLYAQYDLGRLYYAGYGVPKDYAEAAKWYRKAALQGYSLAQFKLGEMYRQGDIESTEYSDSVTEAVYWLNKAALMGNDDAQNSLGLICEMIYFTYPQAMEWYRKAAEQDNAAACRNLGSMYLWGTGIEKDNLEAAKWLKKAADLGDEIAVDYLNKYLSEEYEILKGK